MEGCNAGIRAAIAGLAAILARLAGLATILARLAGLAAILAAGPALAEELGAAGQWLARAHQQDGAKLCYAISAPTESAGQVTDRGPVGALVTHVDGGATRDQVSVALGYAPKAGTLIRLNIDGKAYILRRIEGDRAWARDAAADRLILAAMKKGNRMVVTGVNDNGAKVEDIFSLAGLSKTLRMAAESCGFQ